MDLVAITDHDSIDGGLELLSRAPDGRDVILGEEVSCWLPVDGATGADRRVEVHFGTWGMTETAHRELQPLRGNALEVAAYLRAAGIFFAFNHPFHFYQGQLPLERYLELLVDAAPAIETRNGAMLPEHNHLAAAVARFRAASSSSVAATRTRCAASARRGRRRRARRATSSWPTWRPAVATSAASTAGRSSPPRASTASSRRTGRAWPGLRRHEITVPRRYTGRELLAGDPAGGVRAAHRRRPLEAARVALGGVLGGGPRRRRQGGGAAARRD